MSAFALIGTQQPPTSPTGPGSGSFGSDWPLLRWLHTAQQCAARSALMPFDSARALYTTAAQTGLIQKSRLANRDFERAVSMMEKLALGPWARRV